MSPRQFDVSGNRPTSEYKIVYLIKYFTTLTERGNGPKSFTLSIQSKKKPYGNARLIIITTGTN